ncbi:hypothetical protein DTW90_12020 [Neorhizobium sp. P12A]|uniref:hypothetical protein n=1 Tax=Neorhizobium sp. P12A TaxID=2268027 RepID=UPI0011EC660D|nr:hypothetical protein [Neorhizobium sp. P12A]KAA0698527.1 hypothetical protein DTW90_12020 [Neorhizobium sp. P12A]
MFTDHFDRDSWKTDFQGWDGDTQVGRIRYEANGPKQGYWQWSGHGPAVRERLLPHQGYEKTPRAAAAKAEEYYDRLLAHNGLEDKARSTIL